VPFTPKENQHEYNGGDEMECFCRAFWWLFPVPLEISDSWTADLAIGSSRMAS
jgi:hypothetical protein